MSQDVQPYRPPEATPVGHSGTRVEIRERPAWAINGWIGVLAAAVCVGAVLVLAGTSIPGLAAVPGVVGVVIAALRTRTSPLGADRILSGDLEAAEAWARDGEWQGALAGAGVTLR